MENKKTHPGRPVKVNVEEKLNAVMPLSIFQDGILKSKKDKVWKEASNVIKESYDKVINPFTLYFDFNQNRYNLLDIYTREQTKKLKIYHRKKLMKILLWH